MVSNTHSLVSKLIKSEPISTLVHMIAPIHMQARGEDLSQITPSRFFGNGVILDLRNKKNWDKITADDLKAAGEIQNGDIVAINTGWHIKYSDSMEYFGEAPGLTEDAANYLISKNLNLLQLIPHLLTALLRRA